MKVVVSPVVKLKVGGEGSVRQTVKLSSVMRGVFEQSIEENDMRDVRLTRMAYMTRHFLQLFHSPSSVGNALLHVRISSIFWQRSGFVISVGKALRQRTSDIFKKHS